MRITPLPAGTYFRAKVVVGYLRALLTLVLLALAGTAYGVRLPAQGWLTVLGLFLVGLIPFAVLGILLGHLIGADAAALATGGIVTLFALLGGAYGFQVATSGPVFQVIKALPSYWPGGGRPGSPRAAGTPGPPGAGSSSPPGPSSSSRSRCASTGATPAGSDH